MDRLTVPLIAVPPAPTITERGFTLTEMAVVLAIVTLLIGGMILPMSAQQDIRYNSETQKTLADVTEALYGYAASHSASNGKPYLPCPDTDNDGAENRSGDACTSAEGNLPWAELGVGRFDAWGNALRYRVTDSFANKASGFALLSAGDLRICDSSACTAVLASNIPVVVLSLGKNGLTTPTDVDEVKNKTIDLADKDFVQHTQTPGFDDIVTWLPPSILINRMVSAGRLP
ncbi:MAG: type II secretion system protein [Rhodocyclaceae bacterium]|nr:type II secretion system protein [Rhodocyclaceae bacterium]MDZ4213830.1 type II secretion system protein [Rhodocyclaceae bacterium]